MEKSDKIPASSKNEKDIRLTPEEQKIRLETGIRIGTPQVDKIMNHLSKLILNQSTLNDLKLQFREKLQDNVLYDRFNETLFRLEDNITHLQNEFIKARMVPIGLLFRPFVDYVRDTADALSKKAELEVKGEKTLIDRSMMDALIHPLSHIIRNSISHSLEKPPDRLKNGKKETGKITLSASQTAHSIHITIEDDGYGLDLKKIREKAIDRKIIAPGEELETDRIIDLITSPGFFTRQEISSPSGHADGLDTVKQMISKLRGCLEIEFGEKSGTRFIITLPLSLNIVNALLVQAGKNTLAIPINSINRTFLVSAHSDKEKDSKYETENGELRFLTALWTGEKPVPARDFNQVISISDKKRTMSLAVDHILNEQQLIVKEIDEAFKENPLISGASLLGDGTLVFILNIPGLLSAQGL